MGTANGDDNPEFLYSTNASVSISESTPTTEYQKIASFTPLLNGKLLFYLYFKRISSGVQDNYSIEYLSVRNRTTGEEIYNEVCSKDRSPEYYFWALTLDNLSASTTYDFYMKYELIDFVSRHIYIPTKLELQFNICQKRDNYMLIKNEV